MRGALTLLALALAHAQFADAGLLDPLVVLPTSSGARAPAAKQVPGGLYSKSAPPSFPYSSTKVRGVSLGGCASAVV